jgi:hypothetical protein
MLLADNIVLSDVNTWLSAYTNNPELSANNIMLLPDNTLLSSDNIRLPADNIVCFQLITQMLSDNMFPSVFVLENNTHSFFSVYWIGWVLHSLYNVLKTNIIFLPGHFFPCYGSIVKLGKGAFGAEDIHAASIISPAPFSSKIPALSTNFSPSGCNKIFIFAEFVLFCLGGVAYSTIVQREPNPIYPAVSSYRYLL